MSPMASGYVTPCFIICPLLCINSKSRSKLELPSLMTHVVMEKVSIMMMALKQYPKG